MYCIKIPCNWHLLEQTANKLLLVGHQKIIHIHSLFCDILPCNLPLLTYHQPHVCFEDWNSCISQYHLELFQPFTYASSFSLLIGKEMICLKVALWLSQFQLYEWNLGSGSLGSAMSHSPCCWCMQELIRASLDLLCTWQQWVKQAGGVW